MRALITADWHENLWLKGLERTGDILSAVSTMLQAAVDKDCSLIIIIGDLISPDSGKKYSRYLDLLMAKLRYPVEQGVRVVAIAGNHDVISWPGVEFPVTSLAPLRHIGVEVYEDISSFSVVTESRKDVVCVSIPYILSSYTKPVHGVGAQEYIEKRFFEIIDGVGSEKDIYVFSHLNIDGAMVGQEADMPRCGELFLPKAVEECKRVVGIFNGHYHRPQMIRNRIVIPGSPERLDFGEQDDNKGYVILDL